MDNFKTKPAPGAYFSSSQSFYDVMELFAINYNNKSNDDNESSDDELPELEPI